MFSKQVRFVFLLLLVVAAIWCFLQTYYVLVAFATILILYMIWSYFKHGTVALAAKYYRNGQWEKARQVLSQIQNPDRLSVKRRGYYEFMLGNIALKREEYAKAMQHFQIASAFPLHSQNDKAYILLHLANLSLREQEADRAQVYLDKAREFKTTDKVKELIQKIEKEIKNQSKK